MISKERDQLRDALAQRETAESALESARQASARGRELIGTIVREIEAVEEASMRTSSSLAAEMRAAITRGGGSMSALLGSRSSRGEMRRCFDVYLQPHRSDHSRGTAIGGANSKPLRYRRPDENPLA